MAKYKDELLDHDYDGIRELDNDMPPWWLNLFYITIIWGVLYFAYYHIFGIGYLSRDEYRQEMDPKWTRAQDPSYHGVNLISEYHSPLYSPRGDETPWSRAHSGSAKVAVETPENMPSLEALTDKASLAAGHDIFVAKCASCHGPLGGGNIGPNLTDDFWLHGAGINNIVKTITFGVPQKGMISWRGFLSKDEIHQVASFVISIHGSNPPNPKAPQGDKASQPL
jgi:cytochrome c oxidase cbb3-type subunit III